MTQSTHPLSAEAWDFAPAILALQERPPSPLPRAMLYSLLSLCAGLLGWAYRGRLDIIAVAEGRLVPESYLQIVQPAEAGIVQQIWVKEGDHVLAGQVLLQMDAALSRADSTILQAEISLKELQLRRIDAELEEIPLTVQRTDPPELFRPIEAQYRAHRQAYENALAEDRAALIKAREELAAADEVLQKLKETLPAYRTEEAAWTKLGERQLAGTLQVLEKQRERIEKEQDLKAQVRTVQSLKASVAQSEKHLAQITSKYREQLMNERVEALAQYDKSQQEWVKQQHKNTLLELKAPQAGVIKDLATHTLGAVVSPGTVLMTLVPINEKLQAEVMVKNEDVGFVHAGQAAKLKVAPYPFQKYGLIEGRVVHVSADANAPQTQKEGTDEHKEPAPAKSTYKAIVELNAQLIERDGERFTLTPGMQVVAEINQGSHTILEYLLSPVQGVFHEAMRER